MNKNEKKVLIEKLQEYIQICREKINRGDNMLKDDSILLYAMSVQKLWLSGSGLFVMYTSWDGRKNKDFFPVNSDMFNSAKKVLVHLSKKMF